MNTTSSDISTHSAARPHQNSYLTDPIFCRKVREVFGEEYTVMGMYENSRTKIKIRHNCIKCDNYEWEVFPRNLLQGHGCPKCSGRVVISEEEFKNILGDEYTLLSDYHGITRQVYLNHHAPKRHVKDQKFYITPKQFMQGRKCPECERLAETAKVSKQIEEFSKGTYSLVGDFFSKSEKIRIRHNCEKCNYHEWDITLYNFMQGHGCPKCK